MPILNIKDIPESKMVKLVDLSDDSINKIVEAVAQKIAEPVKHGHWITDMSGCWCSVCNEYSDYSTDYCPNCGAKMDEEVNGNN